MRVVLFSGVTFVPIVMISHLTSLGALLSVEVWQEKGLLQKDGELHTKHSHQALTPNHALPDLAIV